MSWTTQADLAKLNSPLKMIFQTRFIHILFCCSALFAYTTAGANPVRSGEVHVTLFGQPCTLSGPFDEGALKTIHSISPDQIVTEQMTLAQLQAASTKLRSTLPGIPNTFDRYREKLAKRFDQMAAFDEGWDQSQKEGNSAALLNSTRKFLTGKGTGSFATLAHQLDRKPSGSAKASLREKLFEIYGDSIEADPQEDFHRAIRRLNVNYMCAYEELDNSEE